MCTYIGVHLLTLVITEDDYDALMVDYPEYGKPHKFEDIVMKIYI